MLSSKELRGTVLNSAKLGERKNVNLPGVQVGPFPSFLQQGPLLFSSPAFRTRFPFFPFFPLFLSFLPAVPVSVQQSAALGTCAQVGPCRNRTPDSAREGVQQLECTSVQHLCGSAGAGVGGCGTEGGWGAQVDIPVLTAKDIIDLQEFGAKNGMDYVAASFVQTADDVRFIRYALALPSALFLCSASRPSREGPGGWDFPVTGQVVLASGGEGLLLCLLSSLAVSQ